MARYNKRPLNACGACGYTWYPRGRYISMKCPNCGSTNTGCATAMFIGAIFNLFAKLIELIFKLIEVCTTMIATGCGKFSNWVLRMARKWRAQEAKAKRKQIKYAVIIVVAVLLYYPAKVFILEYAPFGFRYTVDWITSWF